ncbi:nitrite reductase small subunit NirD [Fodinibius salsisoli]|uniref:Nitrite reductase small subunit NirD n=1 Tax=Fodinibius salsisoli TaxID=2820877 RepID=A0ABT3PTG5_9BACT|nr:nitrite reductase small subunit NirD [Fodinibius salsisoli]MCW9709153.1 nitrite reductase small subunit NirD [Fodinibius salsisoli]
MEAEQEVKNWFKAAKVEDFPKNGGACIKYKDKQIAVFNFTRRNEWFACQNMCPHKKEMALARGMIGESQGEPKVACPFHKKAFSLQTGENIDGEDYEVVTYPVKIEGGYVYVGLS